MILQLFFDVHKFLYLDIKFLINIVLLKYLLNISLWHDVMDEHHKVDHNLHRLKKLELIISTIKLISFLF